jgi:hypothetical protein
MLLADVGGQVIEIVAPVLPIMDKFPVALPDDRGKLSALIS